MKLTKMSDLSRRLIVSSIAILIIGLLVGFSTHPVVSILVVITIALLAGIGVWEYAQLALNKQISPAITLMIICAITEVIAFYIAHKYSTLSQLPIIVLVASAVAFFLIHFRDTSNAVLNVAVEFFGLCYIAVPISFLLGILYPFPYEGTAQEGRWWLVYLILVTKITDVGGYFIGRLWGKRKLAPNLSPKKTVEGAIAGFICATLMSVLLAYLGQQFSHGSFNLKFYQALILGMFVGVFAQVGDLAESMLKRDAVVKDSNKLPGLGGVLDMVDSLLLTAPIVYFFLKLH